LDRDPDLGAESSDAAFQTLPTPSFSPISRTLLFFPLKENADVRAATFSLSILDRAFSSSLGQAVAKIFVLGVRTNVYEWKYCDRITDSLR
jgi:hypothetical protein